MNHEYNAKFLELRRKIIALRFQYLNDMQREAVLTTEGPLLLLAGAGSGKTTVLINRIANLLQFGCGSDSCEVPPFVTESDVDFMERYLQAPLEEHRGRAELLCTLHRAEPWSILAVTFTNKAANELKGRLEANGHPADKVWAMTFHSVCSRILHRDIDRIGYDRNFVIYDASDSKHVLKQAMQDLGFSERSFDYRRALNEISHT